MQPVSEFRDQLLIASGADPARVTTFSCGHVVPPEQLLPVSLGAGPSGAELVFNYQTRALTTTVRCGVGRCSSTVWDSGTGIGHCGAVAQPGEASHSQSVNGSKFTLIKSVE